MDDFGAIIYIAFLLISLLGGLWTNIQKNRKKTQEPQQTVTHEVNQVKTAAPKVMPARSKERVSLSAQKMGMEYQEKKTRRRMEQVLQEEQIKSSETVTDITLEDFDARKAIIYSEILKPPYL